MKNKKPLDRLLLNAEFTPRTSMDEDRKKRIFYEMMKNEKITKKEVEKFITLVEKSTFFVSIHFMTIKFSGLKKEKAEKALTTITHAIDDLIDAGGTPAFIKSAYNAKFFSDQIICSSPDQLLLEVSAACERAKIEINKKETLSGPSPHRTKNRRQIVSAFMDAWEVITKRKPTASDGTGFCYVMNEIWEFLRENVDNPPRPVVDFRKDVRKIQKQE